MRLFRITALICGLLAAQGAQAQQFDFLIANASLEQIISGQQSAISAGVDGATGADVQTSTSIILQNGADNTSLNSITNSGGSAAAMLQSGDDNTASATILNSPQSRIAGVQIGDSNSMALTIAGGSENVLVGAQIGTANTLDIALVNSTGTTLTYGQLGQGVRGSVTFVNGAPGTQIRLGGETTQ
ncbi:hypothetical protein [Sulfitobacter guttiformis]|uniref:Curlin associated repeat-containing protein n=1 Tax=Sulfitobacter guttiformis TaxID=74349 RepID=A0A420DKB3_9RHOB|nr:hypothetical protein [Sulfitobacter guttiformis]KIN71521.1 hypothetical protein Z949_682 [Sulfitobacter guttiformis KCTC 32187]RKE94641.1 hypothetical protein C8N30_3772 [Sulfitobacter guttiformis]